MQRLLICCAGLAALAACTVNGVTDGSRSARLPVGLTLLESDQEQCAGAVQIDDARGPDLVVRQGQNATFPLADDAGEEIEWSCITGPPARADTQTTECPDATSHVRITRADAGNDDFLFECYGQRDR